MDIKMVVDLGFVGRSDGKERLETVEEISVSYTHLDVYKRQLYNITV